jgi:hypothetical protein
MKKIILPALGLAVAFALSPIASADAAMMHHKHPIVHHHKVHHVAHRKTHHVVHHKKIVHHKKHASAPKY